MTTILCEMTMTKQNQKFTKEEMNENVENWTRGKFLIWE